MFFEMLQLFHTKVPNKLWQYCQIVSKAIFKLFRFLALLVAAAVVDAENLMLFILCAPFNFLEQPYSGYLPANCTDFSRKYSIRVIALVTDCFK
jgi:hypothetical protein